MKLYLKTHEACITAYSCKIHLFRQNPNGIYTISLIVLIFFLLFRLELEKTLDIGDNPNIPAEMSVGEGNGELGIQEIQITVRT